MKIPLISIGNKNVKKQTMLSTLDKRINENDFAYIDYSVEGIKKQSINSLNEIFCDNVIVFTPIEKRYLFNLDDKIEQKIDIKQIPKELLLKTTTNTKFAFSHIVLPKKQQIKPTRSKYIANENYINRSSDYIQMLKTYLDRFPSD